MGSLGDMTATASLANVPGEMPDAIFELLQRYFQDTHPQKINLGIGAYRDGQGKPWVLDSVRAALAKIYSDPSLNFEYTHMAGTPEFSALAARLLFGAKSRVVSEGLVASHQTIGGTSANHIAALLLKKFYSESPSAKIYVSRPTWANHELIFRSAGWDIEEYPYWNPETKSVDMEGMLACLKSAPAGSVVLLHACAHNPTGVDPTHDQWAQIADVMQERQLYAFFDAAYIGFASGNLDHDSWAVREFLDTRGMEGLVCQSFSKSMGLYGERIGALHVACPSRVSARNVNSQMSHIVRAEYSCPPSNGARIATAILANPELYTQWLADLQTMSSRVIEMRKALRAALERRKTPGTWTQITSQIGMFSFPGLSLAQVDALVNEHHIYMTRNGRINVCGITPANVEYLADCIDLCVRTK